LDRKIFPDCAKLIFRILQSCTNSFQLNRSCKTNYRKEIRRRRKEPKKRIRLTGRARRAHTRTPASEQAKRPSNAAAALRARCFVLFFLLTAEPHTIFYLQTKPVCIRIATKIGRFCCSFATKIRLYIPQYLLYILPPPQNSNLCAARLHEFLAGIRAAPAIGAQNRRFPSPRAPLFHSMLFLLLHPLVLTRFYSM
jgi:hypothetical protein